MLECLRSFVYEQRIEHGAVREKEVEKIRKSSRSDSICAGGVDARSYVCRIRVQESVRRHVYLVAHFHVNLIIPWVSRADTLNLACQTRGYPRRKPPPRGTSSFIPRSGRRHFTRPDRHLSPFRKCFLCLFILPNVSLYQPHRYFYLSFHTEQVVVIIRVLDGQL